MTIRAQVHHQHILAYNDDEHAHDHYNFFRSLLSSGYDQELDAMLEKTVRFFEQIQGVPVLLSMLVLLFKHRTAGETTPLPSDSLELYMTAIKLSAGGAAGAEPPEAIVWMLQTVAVANMGAERREFTSAHVAEALAASGSGADGRNGDLELWDRLLQRNSAIPLVKVLENDAIAHLQGQGVFQFKHLSFQEGLFARDLLELVDAKQWDGWQDDAKAAAFLNNAYMNNVCRIAAGELGMRLARGRSHWSFDTHKLTWIGKTALWQLVNDNQHLESLSLSDNGVGPPESGTEGAEANVDAVGLARLFSSCPMLKMVGLSFNRLGQLSTKRASSDQRTLSSSPCVLAQPLCRRPLPLLTQRAWRH